MISTHIITQRDQWNTALHTLPYAHILQTWEWGEFKKATTGWQPERISFRQGHKLVAMASILTRRVGPFAVMYVPRGPVMEYDDPEIVSVVLNYLQTLARKRFAVWLKIDPDVILATGIPGSEDDHPCGIGQIIKQTLESRGWQFSNDQIQFRNTITLDLTATEDELLAAMSQNTRRKIRIGEKKGVIVRTGTIHDLNTLYNLYQITGERDKFLIRPPEYYKRAWQDFLEAGLAHVLIAEVHCKAIAHVILLHFGRKCLYFYGASSNEERNRMPNYLLQWEAIQWAKNRGYEVYDMWGAPDEFNEQDDMWGVYAFKRGFRGTVTRHIGAWDYTPYPRLYKLYTQLWPRVLNWLQRRRKR